MAQFLNGMIPKWHNSIMVHFVQKGIVPNWQLPKWYNSQMEQFPNSTIPKWYNFQMV